MKNYFPGKEYSLFLFGILMLLALQLRLLNLTAEDLWLDEINTLLVAMTHGYPDVILPEVQTAESFFNRHLVWQPLLFDNLMAMLKNNVHMPLYYLLINPWTGWLGTSAAALRLFSVCWSVLLVLLLYGFGSTLEAYSVNKEQAKGGTQKIEGAAGGDVGAVNRQRLYVAFWTAFVTACSPFQLYYAQEARMYPLAMCFAALAAWALWKLAVPPAQKTLPEKEAGLNPSLNPAFWAIVYTVSLLVGVFSHYAFFFQLPFHALFALWQIKKNPQAKHRWFVLPGVALLGALFVWFPVYTIQKASVLELGDHFSDGLKSPLRYVSMMFLAPIKMWAGTASQTRVALMPIAGCLLLFWLINPLWKRLNRIKEGALKINLIPPVFSNPVVYGFLFMWLFVPFLTQSLVDFTQGTHTALVLRYSMLSAPGFYLILGVALTSIPKRCFGFSFPVGHWLRGLFAVSVLTIAVLTLMPGSLFRYDDNTTHFSARRTTDYIAERLQPNDLIAVNGPFAAPGSLAYYLHSTHPEQPILYWVKTYRGKPTQPLTAEMLSSYQRVWLYHYHGNTARGLDDMRALLAREYQKVEGRLGPRHRLMLYSGKK